MFSSGDDDDDPELVALIKEKKLVEDRVRRRRDDETQQLLLQLIGERSSGALGDAKPPDNVLFVCRLNPLTQAEDLAGCFEQFGPVLSCDVVRDRKTGRSLQYAFVEFATAEACSAAFRKMERVKIDDCRIHVDFSQSLGRLYWNMRRGGPAHTRATGPVLRPRTEAPPATGLLPAPPPPPLAPRTAVSHVAHHGVADPGGAPNAYPLWVVSAPYAHHAPSNWSAPGPPPPGA